MRNLSGAVRNPKRGGRPRPEKAGNRSAAAIFNERTPVVTKVGKTPTEANPTSNCRRKPIGKNAKIKDEKRGEREMHSDVVKTGD